MILKRIHTKDYCKLAEPILGVFASEKWLSSYVTGLCTIGIFKDESQLIGGFYYYETRKYGFKFIKLPPYTPHCGLVYFNESKNKSSVNSFSKEVMTEVCNYFNAQKAALSVLAFPSEIMDMQPFIWEKYKVVPNYTYRIDLLKNEEEILTAFDSKNRNAINKSIKEGVEVKCNSLSKAELYNYLHQSLQTTNANIYNNELKAIITKSCDESNSFSFTAYKGNEVIGNVICVFDKKNCYYLLGGVDKKSGIQGINNLLVQSSILKAKSLGCNIFDFEGSMLKGVEKFFRSFGPDIHPYFTANKGVLPLEMILKFKKRELF